MARLAELRKQVQSEYRAGVSRARRRRSRGGQWTAASVGLATAKVLAVILLPFVLYVRSSVFFYQQFGGAWLAVGGGMCLTLIVVAIYAAWLVRGLGGKRGLANVTQWVVAPIVGGWLLYSLVVLAKVNAKSDDVRGWYSSLHPVLRVAVSTAIIMDRDMVVTDMQRVASDYPKMGLKVNPTTRHYVQKDGWVHAVDLRTNGRSEMRNRSLQFYFWATGFSTTRHVGTADHLHVQLRS